VQELKKGIQSNFPLPEDEETRNAFNELLKSTFGSKKLSSPSNRYFKVSPCREYYKETNMKEILNSGSWIVFESKYMVSFEESNMNLEEAREFIKE